MLEILDINQSQRWDEVVMSFATYDVYYLSGYLRPFMIHGDGSPRLLYYENGGMKAMYAFMLRQTAISGLNDTITPYGYGGVLFEGNTSDENLSAFWTAYLVAMKELNVVDNFVRYHPVLKNAEMVRPYTIVIDLGKTIAMDLTSPEVIWDNLTSKKRGKIRKAEKNGIAIYHGKGLELFDQFIPIYNGTMDKDDASGYYYFDRDFYEAIHKDLSNHYEMFYAVYDDKIVMMAIMLYCNGQMHYHLSGSLAEYRHLEPNNLLLYEAALWGYEQGLKTLHLGGGVGSGDDALFKFKEGFNRNSNYRFSIGKQVFDEEAYQRLVEYRKLTDISFDATSSFFPLYRVGD